MLVFLFFWQCWWIILFLMTDLKSSWIFYVITSYGNKESFLLLPFNLLLITFFSLNFLQWLVPTAQLNKKVIRGYSCFVFAFQQKSLWNFRINHDVWHRLLSTQEFFVVLFMNECFFVVLFMKEFYQMLFLGLLKWLPFTLNYLNCRLGPTRLWWNKFNVLADQNFF